MFSKTRKVFIACAFGAGIGSFVALEISAMFCWAGFLLGGFACAILYYWKNVFEAIPIAYRATANISFPKLYFNMIGQIVIFLLNFTTWFIAFMLIIIKEDPTQIILGMCGGLLFVFFLLSLMFYWEFKEQEWESISTLKSLRGVNYYFCPPILFFWHLPRGIVFVVRRTPSYVVYFFYYLWNLFLQIHLEPGVPCIVDALLGACVGYFAGSAIAGALIGGVFGVFNYLVVTEFCLKRLKLIPIKE